MTDIWVCANCRSVNNLRAKQCYNCRTPKDRAAVDPSQIDGTTKGQLREIELPEFQSSRPFAILAAVLIVAVAVVQAANSLLSVDEVTEQVDEFGFAIVTIDTVSPLALPTYVVAAAALVAFALWLSRAVGSMPALGLGYPAATSTTAFLEVFIPGLNLMRIPAILRDMIRRLEPQEGRGDVLIYASWIGLFGGILLPRVGLYLGLFSANTSDSGAQTLVIVRLFSTLLVLGGAIFLVALIWWLEGRIAHRREQQLAGVPAPAPPTNVAPGAAAGLSSLPPGTDVSFRPGGASVAPASAAAATVAAPVAATGPAQAPTAEPARPAPSAATRLAPEPAVGRSSDPSAPAAEPLRAETEPTAPAPGGTAPSAAGPVPIDAPTASAAPPAGVAPMPPPASPIHAAPLAATAPSPIAASSTEPAPPPATTATSEPSAVSAATPAPPPPVTRSAPRTEPDPVLTRPITAAAGHAHMPSDTAPLAADATTDAAGPHLQLEVADDGSILASLDGSDPEPTTVEELREAAIALAEAGGSVSVAGGRSGAGHDVAAEIVTALDNAGVPTTVEPPA